jgi:hypothetical protein
MKSIIATSEADCKRLLDLLNAMPVPPGSHLRGKSACAPRTARDILSSPDHYVTRRIVEEVFRDGIVVVDATDDAGSWHRKVFIPLRLGSRVERDAVRDGLLLPAHYGGPGQPFTREAYRLPNARKCGVTCEVWSQFGGLDI